MTDCLSVAISQGFKTIMVTAVSCSCAITHCCSPALLCGACVPIIAGCDNGGTEVDQQWKGDARGTISGKHLMCALLHGVNAVLLYTSNAGGKVKECHCCPGCLSLDLYAALRQSTWTTQ